MKDNTISDIWNATGVASAFILLSKSKLLLSHKLKTG